MLTQVLIIDSEINSLYTCIQYNVIVTVYSKSGLIPVRAERLYTVYKPYPFCLYGTRLIQQSVDACFTHIDVHTAAVTCKKMLVAININ